MDPSTRAGKSAAQPQPPPRLDFEHVYESHFDFVWANVRRLGVPPAAVDDVVQDVFLAVYRRLPTFEGRASLKTWLFHFVLRIVANHRRASHSAQRVQGAPPAAAVASGADTTLEARQSAELLYRLLDELTDERRALFVLVELEEVTIPEAAQLLGVNTNTAYSRLRDARRDFEQGLARERAREDWRGR